MPTWLERLAETIDFECFHEPLTRGLGYGDRQQGGRPPFDPVMMFKILILQTRENLSDDKTELLVRDRLTWLQFLGLHINADTPDENTIRHFRNCLAEAEILDASIVECPKQHNTAAENAAIKAGQSAWEIWPKEPNKAGAEGYGCALDGKEERARGKILPGCQSEYSCRHGHEVCSCGQGDSRQYA